MSQTATTHTAGDHWARRVLPWLFDAGFAPTVILVMVLTMTFKSDVFFTARNLQNILLQTSFLAIAAFGMTFVIIAAELDLSQGSSIALIGVITADVMVKNESIFLGILAGLATGLILGLIIGFVTVVLRVPSFITTLGMLVMARGLAREITSGSTIGGFPESWMVFWSYKILGLRMPIWAALAVGAVFHIVLRYTQFGLRVYAVGGNTEAARRAGINVVRVRIAVFLTGGFALAIAGFTLLGRVNSGQPNAAVLTELFAVAAVVLGGTNLFGGISIGGLTENRTTFGPLISGCSQVPAHDIESLKEELEFQDSETVAAVILEPVQAAGGVYPPPENYLKQVRQLCDQYNVLLILDEVVCGWGRLGHWFGGHRYDTVADIMTTAKGLTSAYVPMGAAIVNERIHQSFIGDEGIEFMHGYTYSGHPAACAAGLAVIEILERESIVENSKDVGAYLQMRIRELSKYDEVKETRGEGMLAAVEFGTKNPTNTVTHVVNEMQNRGILIRAQEDHVGIYPPLTFSNEDIDMVLNTLHEVVGKI